MTLHPQARALLDALDVEQGPDVRVDHAAVRAAMRAAAVAQPSDIALEHIVDVDAGGVPCRLYRPSEGAPVALYVHGGGWVLHDLETHDSFCRYLADATGWALLAVDYRLAPEHPHPAPLDDVETAARWLRSHTAELDVDATWLPAIGDSSGANLIAGLCVRDPTVLDFQALMYPPVDAKSEWEGPGDTTLSADVMRWFWDVYGPTNVDHPEVSPSRATNLTSHPPALVVTAEHDLLRDEGEAYAAALIDAGVEVTALRALGMVHSFWRQPTLFDSSRAIVRLVGATLDAGRAAPR